MSVETKIRAQIDHIHSYKTTLLAAVASRSLLWYMADDSDDITYKNVVCGSQLTAVDTALNNITFGSAINPFFSLHQTYFAAGNVNGVTTFGGAITKYQWRVGKYFNDFYRAALGSNVTTAYVWPAPSQTLLSITVSGATTASGSGAASLDLTVAGLGRLGIVPSQTMTSTPAVALTVVHFDDTTTSVSTTMSAGTATKTIGQQTITGATQSTGVITLAATGQFKVGQYVLLSKTDESVQELVEITSISTNTSITCKKIGTADGSGILNTVFGSASAVFPLYKGISAFGTISSGTSAENMTVKTMDDRTCSMSYSREN